MTLLNLAETQALLHVSRSTFRTLRKRPDFPRPHTIASKTMYARSAGERWIKEQQA